MKASPVHHPPINSLYLKIVLILHPSIYLSIGYGLFSVEFIKKDQQVVAVCFSFVLHNITTFLGLGCRKPDFVFLSPIIF